MAGVYRDRTGRKFRNGLRAAGVLALFGVSACGGSAEEVPTAGAGSLQGAVNDGDSANTASSANDGDHGVDATTSVTLERSVCFGACPAYSLHIGGDGTVTYRGERYVKVVGEASRQIPVPDVAALVDAMLDANYLALSMPSDCDRYTTDSPTVKTSLTWRGQTNAIDHDHGNPCAPAALQGLEDRIDEVAGSAQWLQCDPPAATCYGVR